MYASFATALEMADALDAVFASNPAHPNEIGAWLAVFAAGALREQWNLRSRLLDASASTEWGSDAPVPRLANAATLSERPPSAEATWCRRRPIDTQRNWKALARRILETIGLSMLVIAFVVLAVLTDRAMDQRSGHASGLPGTVVPIRTPTGSAH